MLPVSTKDHSSLANTHSSFGKHLKGITLESNVIRLLYLDEIPKYLSSTQDIPFIYCENITEKDITLAKEQNIEKKLQSLRNYYSEYIENNQGVDRNKIIISFVKEHAHIIGELISETYNDKHSLKYESILIKAKQILAKCIDCKVAKEEVEYLSVLLSKSYKIYTLLKRNVSNDKGIICLIKRVYDFLEKSYESNFTLEDKEVNIFASWVWANIKNGCTDIKIVLKEFMPLKHIVDECPLYQIEDIAQLILIMQKSKKTYPVILKDFINIVLRDIKFTNVNFSNKKIKENICCYNHKKFNNIIKDDFLFTFSHHVYFGCNRNFYILEIHDKEIDIKCRITIFRRPEIKYIINNSFNKDIDKDIIGILKDLFTMSIKSIVGLPVLRESSIVKILCVMYNTTEQLNCMVSTKEQDTLGITSYDKEINASKICVAADRWMTLAHEFAHACIYNILSDDIKIESIYKSYIDEGICEMCQRKVSTLMRMKYATQEITSDTIWDSTNYQIAALNFYLNYYKVAYLTKMSVIERYNVDLRFLPELSSVFNKFLLKNIKSNASKGFVQTRQLIQQNTIEKIIEMSFDCYNLYDNDISKEDIELLDTFSYMFMRKRDSHFEKITYLINQGKLFFANKEDYLNKYVSMSDNLTFNKESTSVTNVQDYFYKYKKYMEEIINITYKDMSDDHRKSQIGSLFVDFICTYKKENVIKQYWLDVKDLIKGNKNQKDVDLPLYLLEEQFVRYCEYLRNKLRPWQLV